PEFGRWAPGGPPCRGRRSILLIGAPQPAEHFGVDVLGPGQRDPDGGGADVPRGEQAASGAFVLKPQAEVHAALGRRLAHGEDTAGGGQADERFAGLHRHRAERDQRRQHRVEYGPKLLAVGVLGCDQLLRLPQGAAVTAESGAVQLAGLAAKLIQIGPTTKLRHAASPHRARSRIPARLKTIRCPASDASSAGTQSFPTNPWPLPP